MYEVDIELMRDFIRNSKIKQKDLARKSGIAECKLSFSLNGKRKFEAGEYASVCKSLGVRLDDFIIQK